MEEPTKVGTKIVSKKSHAGEKILARPKITDIFKMNIKVCIFKKKCQSNL
jgi:predicted RNA-binding protein